MIPIGVPRRGKARDDRIDERLSNVRTVSLFLSVDFGTESARAAIFDAEGRLLLTERPSSTPRAFPQAGWASRNIGLDGPLHPRARKLVGRLKEELGERPESILSMAVDGTSCTVLALGADHAPLRDALLWMDVRAFKQADRIARSGRRR